MSWQDRIKEAAYTSPSGARIAFDYQDVSQTVDVRSTPFEFAGVDGSYVQPGRRSARRFPVRAMFGGPDHDLDATEFEKALYETGVGQLEHPLYGTFDALPVGEVKRRDALVTSAGTTTIEVVFFETTGALYPSSAEDLTASLKSAVEDATAAAASEFAGGVDLDTAVERVKTKNAIQAALSEVKNATQSLADVNDKVAQELKNNYDSTSRSLDILIGDPLTLAFQVQQTIKTPARSSARTNAKLDAYANLASDLVSEGQDEASKVSAGSGSASDRNELATRGLLASSYVTSSALSIAFSPPGTREEAVLAAASILEQFDEVREWREEAYEVSGDPLELETHEAYEKTFTAVSLAAGVALQASFSLPSRKTLVLDRDRTILDVAAELYGEVDSRLDEMIKTNRLVGSQIIELKKGTRIDYYI